LAERSGRRVEPDPGPVFLQREQATVLAQDDGAGGGEGGGMRAPARLDAPAPVAQDPLAALREDIRQAGRRTARVRLSLVAAALGVVVLAAAPHIVAALTPSLKLYGFLPAESPLLAALYSLPMWGLTLMVLALMAGAGYRAIRTWGLHLRLNT
jgi:hypothetical protein